MLLFGERQTCMCVCGERRLCLCVFESGRGRMFVCVYVCGVKVKLSVGKEGSVCIHDCAEKDGVCVCLRAGLNDVCVCLCVCG